MRHLFRIFLLTFTTTRIFAQVETFDVPRLDSIRIDGDFGDWDAGPGFGVEVLLQEAGEYKKPDDHNVHFRLGWNQASLLIDVEVEDNSWIEYPEKGKYYSADVVEVFLASQRGDDDVCQWYVTPGMSEAVSEPGVRFRELRRGPTKGMPSEMKVFREKLSDTRYRMEMSVPWASIGKTGEAGTKVAFQIWVNDKDKGDLRSRYMSIFYPAKGASYASGSMHNLHLVEDTEPSLRISSLGEYDTERFQPFIRLWARAERAGKQVFVKLGDEIIGSGTLNGTEVTGRATAKVLLPPPPENQPYEKLGVFLEDEPVNSVSLPYSVVIGALKNIYEKRATYRERFQLDAPWVDLEDPLLDRHRGLAAAGLNLLEQDPLPSGEKEMEVLATLIDMLADLEKGEDYFAKQRNGLWGYYFCKADGTGQRFSMTIPRDFDPNRRYPMFLELHGNGGRPLPPQSEAKQDDFFRVRPWGRGDISFFGLGEVDVLESLRHVLKWYPIDPDQICLGGHSMGGNATWDLASKYTNLFACLAPKAGRSGDDYYENFRHLPAFIQHGAKDGSQPVDFGRYTVSRLEQLGFPVIYKEFPEDGHGIRNPFPIEEWFVTQRRPRSPEIITYTCDPTITGEIYWAKIRRFLDPHRPATIEARFESKNETQSLALELRNIEVLELNLEDVPSVREKPLLLKLGEVELQIETPQPKRVTIVREEGDWTLADSWKSPSDAMRSYQPGATAHLYRGEPLLIVYPTEGSKETRKTMEDAAREIVLFGGFGNEMITGQVPIKADKDVTETDIQHRNLILFGGPAFNLVTRKLADRLPLKVNDESQFVVEGEPPMPVADSSLQLTYPNPLAPKQLIHLIWQDDIPAETRNRFVRSSRYRLPGSSGRNPHNVPDLQIASSNFAISIRRQFTFGWKLKEPQGKDLKQSQQAISEGIDVTRLRLMKENAQVDYAIGQGGGDWRKSDPEPLSFDQFRYRNFRLTTFRAKIKGSNLAKVLADPTSRNLKIYPSIGEKELVPEREYSIVAPESILWSAKSISRAWFDMVAGPDVLKEDFVREIFGEVE